MGNLGHARHSKVQNVVLRDRRRTSDTVSSAWQARHFLHVVKTLAGGGRHERCFRNHFSLQAHCLVNLDDVSKWSKFSFCETVKRL